MSLMERGQDGATVSSPGSGWTDSLSSLGSGGLTCLETFVPFCGDSEEGFRRS